jgi:hypothetical protein
VLISTNTNIENYFEGNHGSFNTKSKIEGVLLFMENFGSFQNQSISMEIGPTITTN